MHAVGVGFASASSGCVAVIRTTVIPRPGCGGIASKRGSSVDDWKFTPAAVTAAAMLLHVTAPPVPKEHSPNA